MLEASIYKCTATKQMAMKEKEEDDDGGRNG
jgi:hypothetical protein